MFIAIVPAHNEEKRIEEVVLSLFPHVEEVVVIDDGSHDDTAVRARNAGAVVLTHTINLGQGAALETGHAYARARGATAVLHFDGDGQFNPTDIISARQYLLGGADIVLGSRFLEKKSQIPWIKRYIILPVGRFVNRLFGGLKLTDAHNGFRVLGPRALQRIEITHNRMAHATEIVELIRKHGLVYVEVPIHVTYHEYGQKMSGGFSILKDLFFGKFMN